MAAKRSLPRCPHCGRQLGFWEAWLVHAQGEYECPRCLNPSNIKYHRNVYRLAVFTVLIGVLFFICSYLLLRGDSAWGILPVSLPFILFTLFSARFMRLEGFGVRRTPKIAPGYLGVPGSQGAPPVSGGPLQRPSHPAALREPRRRPPVSAPPRRPMTPPAGTSVRRQTPANRQAPTPQGSTQKSSPARYSTEGFIPPKKRAVPPASQIQPPREPHPKKSLKEIQDLDDILEEFVKRHPKQ